MIVFITSVSRDIFKPQWCTVHSKNNKTVRSHLDVFTYVFFSFFFVWFLFPRICLKVRAGCLDSDPVTLLDKLFSPKYGICTLCGSDGQSSMHVPETCCISWFSPNKLPVWCSLPPTIFGFACELSVTNCKHSTVSLSSDKLTKCFIS